MIQTGSSWSTCHPDHSLLQKTVNQGQTISQLSWPRPRNFLDFLILKGAWPSDVYSDESSRRVLAIGDLVRDSALRQEPLKQSGWRVNSRRNAQSPSRQL